MDPQRWQIVKRIPFEALQKHTEERQAFLDQSCGDDEELRTEVTLLLAADEDAGDFLSAPTANVSERCGEHDVTKVGSISAEVMPL